MKKLILTSILIPLAAMAQSSVTVNFSINISAALLSDINTHWMEDRSLLGNTNNVVAATDSSLTFYLSPEAKLPKDGDEVSLDTEPMKVTGCSLNGTSQTVTCLIARGKTQNGLSYPLAVPSQHSTGAKVYVLRYKHWSNAIQAEAFAPWARAISVSLGNDSAVFGSNISAQ